MNCWVIVVNEAIAVVVAAVAVVSNIVCFGYRAAVKSARLCLQKRIAIRVHVAIVDGAVDGVVERFWFEREELAGSVVETVGGVNVVSIVIIVVAVGIGHC